MEIKSLHKMLQTFLLLVLSLLITLLLLINISSYSEFIKNSLELIGTLIATFIGVYLSSLLAYNQELEGEARLQKKRYLHALKILASEIDINKKPLQSVTQALENMPTDIHQYFDNYTFLIEMSDSISTKSFYQLVGSDTFNEISINDELFNAIQQAYYNTALAVNGLRISREVFRGYPKEEASKIVIDRASSIRLGEITKLKSVEALNTKAYIMIQSELSKYGVSFISHD